MAKGINKVILVGSLGQDPEVKYTQSGAAITNISVATNDSWTDKQSGQKQERTEWHRIVFFNRLAEIAGEYLRKGSQVYIEGALRTRKWQDQQGQDKYTTEIVASEMQMLGGKGDSTPQQRPQQVPQQQAPQQRPQQNNRAAPSSYGNVPHAQQQQAPGPDSFDDDIPF